MCGHAASLFPHSWRRTCSPGPPTPARKAGWACSNADSSSWTVALSPGASYAVLDNVSLYGFLQLPVYEYVSGVQLVADWGGVIGVSTRF